MKHVKLKKISLKNHPTINEKWLQQVIVDDPSLLGLGELVVRDKERRQLGGGRLDLLLQEAETTARYEVELQLGATDESHIIRTLEYWDIERKRYPQYEHTAVIIAEEITSRFLNVISLFNGAIPLIAIQVTAYELDDGISLSFTKVLDSIRLGLVDEDEEIAEPTDRNYWEVQKSTKETMKLVDQVLELTHSFDENLKLSYNKHYIGFWLNGSAYNFVTVRPRKSVMLLEFKMSQEKMDSIVAEELGENSELDIMDYDRKWGRSRIRITPTELKEHTDIITKLLKTAYDLRK